MSYRFPQALEDKIAALLKPLRDFGIQNSYLYRIEDLDPAVAADPNYDDSGWDALENRTLRRDQGVTWVRTTVVIPENCADIPIEGSQVRLSTETGSALFAPVDIWVDGRLVLHERSWMDFKCPEGIISESAVPGSRHIVAMRFDLNEKCYWLNDVRFRIISDRVEQCVMHLESIVAELKYMEDYEGTEPLLDKAYALLDAAALTGRVMDLRAAEAQSRALFEGYRDQVKRSKVSLIGHAHIDMNWFWSMEETRDIVKRDFTTMTNLMDRYPDFCFSQSQCATYQFTQEDSPEVFEAIRKRAAEGRWDVTASTWVEGDLNMAQGEAILRHVLYSKEYLKDHFDNAPRIMWCPDTFGHPGTLPQILKLTGLDRYYHMRCGLGVGSSADPDDPHWASFRYLEDSLQVPVYWWKGLDGTRVLVCNTMYNRALNTSGILLASRRMKDFGVDNAMLTYGVGDHGGGPTVRDIEWVRTIREFPTTPTIEFSTTERYYSYIEQGDFRLPEREGEMNFVFDGCYTTHADVKRQNRLCEEGLMAVEKLYAIAARHGVPYPYDELRKYWRKTLFNQFHDILDGSGVTDTYVFTRVEAKEVLDGIDSLTERAMRAIAGEGAGNGAYLVFNPTGFDRSGAVTLPAAGTSDLEAFDAEGNRLACQVAGDRAQVYVENVPASGFATVTLKPAPAKAAPRHVERVGQYYCVDTPLYRMEIRADNGQITSLYAKEMDWYVVRRESIGWRLKNGVLNSLQVHMEEPTEMSGWTIGNVRTVHNLLSGAQSEVICDGEVEVRIRFTHHILDSTIWQDIVVHPQDPEIRFETKVDWREYGYFDRDAPMLRAVFAPSVSGASHATYEIPFGTLQRPCDDNEYPSLNWVDLSAGGRGMAILNDCKYGHKCKGNVMELALIRSGWLPDQKSDVGAHEFTYSIYPHPGDWESAGVLARGQAMNQKLVVAPAGDGAKAGQLVSVEGAVLSNIKRAEDGSGTVLRLYQPADRAGEAVIRTDCLSLASAEEVDGLERPIAPVAAEDARTLRLPMKPYEIRTIKIPD